MKRSTRVWIGGLAIVALATVAGVAIGGTSSDSAFKGPPLKLLSLGSKGSPASDYPDIEVGAAAAARAINKRGGIGGREVIVDFCNTNFNANDAAACARKAVSEGYAAVVGYHTGGRDSAVLPTLEQGKVPAIGLESTGIPADATNPASWPFQDGTLGSYLTLPYAADALNLKRVVFVRVDIASLAGTSNLMRQAADAGKLGITFLPDVKVPLTGVTDYSPYAQQIKNSGAQAAIFAVQPGALSGIAKATEAIGYKVTWMSNPFNTDEPLLKSIGSSVDGMVLASPFPPFRAAKNLKPIKQFTEELALEVKQGNRPADVRYLRPAGLNAWLSVYAVAAAAKQVKGTVDNVSLWDSLPTMKPMALANGLVIWRPADAGKASFLPRMPGGLLQLQVVKNGNIVRLTPRLKSYSGIRSIRGQ